MSARSPFNSCHETVISRPPVSMISLSGSPFWSATARSGWSGSSSMPLRSSASRCRYCSRETFRDNAGRAEQARKTPMPRIAFDTRRNFIRGLSSESGGSDSRSLGRRRFLRGRLWLSRRLRLAAHQHHHPLQIEGLFANALIVIHQRSRNGRKGRGKAGSNKFAEILKHQIRRQPREVFSAEHAYYGEHIRN